MSRKADLASHMLQLLRAQMLCHSMPFLTNIKAQTRQCGIRGRYHYVILFHKRLLKAELPGGPQTDLQCQHWAQTILSVGSTKPCNVRNPFPVSTLDFLFYKHQCGYVEKEYKPSTQTIASPFLTFSIKGHPLYIPLSFIWTLNQLDKRLIFQQQRQSLEDVLFKDKWTFIYMYLQSEYN